MKLRPIFKPAFVLAAVRVALYGPTLKTTYPKKEDIPKGYEALYSEDGDEWKLTGVEGLKSQGDVDTLKSALEKERGDHKKAKQELAAWKKLGETPEAVHTQLDRIEELEALAGDKGDPEKIDKLVDAKVKAKTAALTREIDTLKTTNAELTATNTELGGKIKHGRIETQIRKAAEAQGVLPAAIDDLVLMADRFFDVADDDVVQTKEGNGTKAGLTVDQWLTNQKQARPHLWPQSQSGNARGGNGRGGGDPNANPWSKAGWNKTNQAVYVRTHGEQKAADFAKSAGSDLHAAHPPEK